MSEDIFEGGDLLTSLFVKLEHAGACGVFRRVGEVSDATFDGFCGTISDKRFILGCSGGLAKGRDVRAFVESVVQFYVNKNLPEKSIVL